jgi:quinol monooxygenase YgiN
MHALSGYLEFREEERAETLAALRAVTERSRQDPGCVDYWWAEDLEVPNRFRFFECWNTLEAFEAHQAQPYETAFMEQHVARITGADAHILDMTGRRPAYGG